MRLAACTAVAVFAFSVLSAVAFESPAFANSEHRGGYKVCPSGYHVAFTSKSVGPYGAGGLKHVWYQGSNDWWRTSRYDNIGMVQTKITHTWKRSAFWRVYLTGRNSDLFWAWCGRN